MGALPGEWRQGAHPLRMETHILCTRCPATTRPQAGTARPTADPAHHPFHFRNKQRMYFALKSLLQEAQNNLKIFKVRGASVLWLSHSGARHARLSSASCSAPGQVDTQGGPSKSIPGPASPPGCGFLDPGAWALISPDLGLGASEAWLTSAFPTWKWETPKVSLCV